jgi:uncharacterized protein Yka (UPF0111/DUF47 family)
VFQAIEATAGSAMHFGDRLCDVLGSEAAMSFMRFVLRTATQGLLGHQSQALVQDRIRAELAAQFSGEGKRLLRTAGEHAGLVFELATLVRDGLRDVAAKESPSARLTRRAQRYEHDADQLVMAIREAVWRRPDYTPLLRLAESADDAADQLEDAAFLLELLGGSEPRGAPLEALGALADLLVEAGMEWIKALADATRIGRAADGAAPAVDTNDFLMAIDRVAELEHRADDAERALTHAAVQHASDFRQLHVYTAMGDSLEAAADALKRSSLMVRDYVLGDVLRG